MHPDPTPTPSSTSPPPHDWCADQSCPTCSRRFFDAQPSRGGGEAGRYAVNEILKSIQSQEVQS